MEDDLLKTIKLVVCLTILLFSIFYAMNCAKVVRNYPDCAFSRDPILCGKMLEKNND